ncbi:MAG: hypothetical protein JSS78_02025 [Bacteroidetes bacterium]|nr:hypothetical protein [Bacteroidota bacterium]
MFFAYLKRYFLLVLGAFILSIFALYNNFPIVTGDTGSYINSGFALKTPIDRPIFYGLFLRITSLGASIWMTIFAQSLIVAYVIISFVRKLIPQSTSFLLIAIFFFLSLLTTCGWFSSNLMPDIFVSVLMLSLTLFIRYSNSVKENVILCSIILLTVLTHNSNFILLTLFCGVYFVGYLFSKPIRKYLSRFVYLSLFCIISWIALCFTNYLGGNGFNTSKSTHVFIMGKLVESGVLKTYLDKACPLKHYAICQYKDNLPPVAWEFHWDATSPLQKTGGWEANRKENTEIIRDIFSRPKYYPFIAYKAVEATARQLVLFNIDGSYVLPWIKFDESTAPYQSVKEYFPHEINQLTTSRMNQKTLSVGLFDAVYALVIILSTICGCLLIANSTHKREYIILASILGLLIILNAFITATLSSVNARFNARVIWLLPFLNIIFIYKATQAFWQQTKAMLNRRARV